MTSPSPAVGVTRSATIQAAVAKVERHIRGFLTLTLILAATGVGIGWWGLYQFKPEKLAELGNFLAGTVGPIWSVAGLVLIYVAFLAQRRQILLQEESIELNRIELQDTREELKGQREQLELQKNEMERQNALARRQAFEASFFELLRFFREVASHIRASPGNHPYDGQEAFVTAAGEIAGRLSIAFKPELSDEHFSVFISQHMRAVCLSPVSDFGPYFRTLYHLIRLIDESDVANRQRYASLVRAQLSNAELLLLLANGLTDIGRPKFKPLIEEYALLKPIRTSQNVDKPFEGLRRFYSEKAFGSDNSEA